MQDHFCANTLTKIENIKHRNQFNNRKWTFSEDMHIVEEPSNSEMKRQIRKSAGINYLQEAN